LKEILYWFITNLPQLLCYFGGN